MSSESTASGPGAAMAQVMGHAKTAAEDFTRMFSEMKMPAVPDMEALMHAQRRNMEAMSAANRIALEGAQAVAKRHMEIMQQTMTEMTETMRAFASSETPQAKAAKQADLLKRAYERAVSNTKELSDLIARSNGEAITTLNKRFAEAMDEVKQLVSHAKTIDG
jgi:phasin family protein